MTTEEKTLAEKVLEKVRGVLEDSEDLEEDFEEPETGRGLTKQERMAHKRRGDHVE